MKNIFKKLFNQQKSPQKPLRELVSEVDTKVEIMIEQLAHLGKEKAPGATVEPQSTRDTSDFEPFEPFGGEETAQ